MALLDRDSEKCGTNADNSKSSKYCSFCYQDGKFLDEGITLKEKIEKNIQIAVSINIPEEKAREMAETVLPNLERWRS
jgi:hypothetical protein